MPVTSKLFRLNPSSLLAAKENFASDAIKMALVTAQSFAFDTDQYWDVATAHWGACEDEAAGARSWPWRRIRWIRFFQAWCR